jgi:hypothetical protein
MVRVALALPAPEFFFLLAGGTPTLLSMPLVVTLAGVLRGIN